MTGLLSDLSDNQQRPLIIAHRGASAVAPENTLAAFKRAIELGADGIELDVRLAKNGVPVVIHDATLRRTGRLSVPVSQLTAAELRYTDVGAWFDRKHPTLAPTDISLRYVPTLQEVLRLCSSVRLTLYIELKSDRGSSMHDLAGSVITELTISRSRSQAVVVSFDLETLRLVKKLDSEIQTGSLFGPRDLVVRKSASDLVKAARDTGSQEILLHKLIARPRLVESARKHNLRVVVWTVNAPSWLNRNQELDFHALITNDPACFVIG